MPDRWADEEPLTLWAQLFLPWHGPWEWANLALTHLRRSELAPPLQARTSPDLLLTVAGERKSAGRTYHSLQAPSPATRLHHEVNPEVPAHLDRDCGFSAVTSLPGPALTSPHDIRSDKPTRRGDSRVRGERPGEGEPSWVEVSAAPPRRHCPPQSQLRAEGAAPDCLSNILKGGAFRGREGEGKMFAPDWCSSFDGWHQPSKEGWSVKEHAQPISTQFSLECDSPPLETTPYFL